MSYVRQNILDGGSYSAFIRELVVINLFIANLFIAAITNYTAPHFVLKGAASAALFFFLLPEIKSFVSDKGYTTKEFKRMSWILIVFTFILAASISYSDNREYGLQKLLNHLLSALPAVISAFLIIRNWSKLRTNASIISVFLLSIFGGVVILLTDPFFYSTAYEFSAGRWSHVISGRFLGMLTILILIFFAYTRDIKYLLLESLILILLALALYITALRSAILSVIFLFPFILLYIVRMKQITFFKLLLLLIVLFASVTLMNKLEVDETKQDRYETLREFKEEKPQFDSPIKARLEAWKISYERFLDRRYLGVGLGGFNVYYKSALPLEVKYPHNLFLEFMTELGLLGIILFLFLMLTILRGLRNTSPYLYIFFAYAFILSMFSKDIPGQALLWAALAFVALSDAQKVQLKSNACPPKLVNTYFSNV